MWRRTAAFAISREFRPERMSLLPRAGVPRPSASPAQRCAVRVPPDYWPRAKRELARRDPVLGAVIRGNPKYSLARRGDAFFTLARSIIGQQISVRAAQSVWNRLAAVSGAITPACLVAIDIEQLRACGLSARKAEYMHSLCRHFLDGSLQVEQWGQWEDEAIIADLVGIRGIGRWTAEMFLIFHLLRPNVLPLDDLGLRNAMRLQYGKGRELSATRMRRIAKNWQPWCSVATWYLWRSLEPVPVEY